MCDCIEIESTWSSSAAVIQEIGVFAINVKSQGLGVIRSATRVLQFDPGIIRDRARLSDLAGQLIVVTASSATGVPAGIAKIGQLGKQVLIYVALSTWMTPVTAGSALMTTGGTGACPASAVCAVANPLEAAIEAKRTPVARSLLYVNFM